MKARDYAAAAAIVVVLAAAGVWLAASAEGRAEGSALSRGPGGWLAARRYLEARGATVTLLDTPEPDPRGVLVVVLPWQRVDPSLGRTTLQRHLARGGTVVVAYAEDASWEGPALAAALGMGHASADDEPPLHPLRWREFAGASATLAPAAGHEPLRVAALRDRLLPPADATVLFRDEAGHPAVFSYRRGAGLVVALPASAFSNARIQDAGNASLLESLLAGLGREWSFDEYHHGLVAAAHAAAGTATARALDLFLAQVAFVYALAVLAVVRRPGPAWREPPVVAGSTASFLRGVGALHHRLGHHADAADLLVARARQMHPRLAVPEVAGALGPDALLRLARAVGRAQSGEEKSE